MTTAIRQKIKYLYPLATPQTRLLIWKKIRGAWKKRKISPTQELKKLRKEWEKKLPALR